jgi:hypothetical protein
MVLNPYPGRLFLGKVDYVISASGGGQFTTSGTIPNAARIGSDGLYAVRINFSDAEVARKLSIGSGGSATIYTDKGKAMLTQGIGDRCIAHQYGQQHRHEARAQHRQQHSHVSGHLGDENDAGHRGTHHAGEEGGHAHQRKCLRLNRERWE